EDYLLFLRDSSLMVQPFDSAALKVTGDAKVIAAPVSTTGTILPLASVSRNGVMVYTAGSGNPPARISWVGRDGKRLGDIGGPALWVDVSLSPDGKRLVATKERDIWMFDLTASDLVTATPVRFTFSGRNRSPVWSADGSTIAFSRGFQIFQKPSNQSAAETVLAEPPVASPGRGYTPSDWSRSHLLFSNEVGDLATLASGQQSVFQKTDPLESQGRFSPNGKWIAYESYEAGVSAIWVQSFPPTGAKWQISNLGLEPRWRADGKELYYITRGKLTAVRVRTDTVFS